MRRWDYNRNPPGYRYTVPNNPDAYLAYSQRQANAWQPREYGRRELLPPGYLRPGYGNVKKWPFSTKKALAEPGYRRGVRKSMRNPAYSLPYRQAATRRYRTVKNRQEEEYAQREHLIADAAEQAAEFTYPNNFVGVDDPEEEMDIFSAQEQDRNPMWNMGYPHRRMTKYQAAAHANVWDQARVGDQLEMLHDDVDANGDQVIGGKRKRDK